MGSEPFVFPILPGDPIMKSMIRRIEAFSEERAHAQSSPKSTEVQSRGVTEADLSFNGLG